MKTTEEQKNYIQLTDYGRIKEIHRGVFNPNGGQIQKAAQGIYIDRETGEVIEPKKPAGEARSRSENKKSLSATRKTVKDLAIANFENKDKTLFVTLTFNEPERDMARFNSRFNYFIDKMKRHFKDNPFKYLMVPEYNANGGLHCHALFFWEKDCSGIPFADIQALWTYGNADIQLLRDNEEAILNVTAYMTAALGMANHGGALPETIPHGAEEKRAVKAARVSAVPAFTQLCRHSNGMKKPTKRFVTAEEADELSKSCHKIQEKPHQTHLADGSVLYQQYAYFVPNEKISEK